MCGGDPLQRHFLFARIACINRAYEHTRVKKQITFIAFFTSEAAPVPKVGNIRTRLSHFFGR